MSQDTAISLPSSSPLWNTVDPIQAVDELVQPLLLL
jgi:hypothetical protein